MEWVPPVINARVISPMRSRARRLLIQRRSGIDSVALPAVFWTIGAATFAGCRLSTVDRANGCGVRVWQRGRPLLITVVAYP